MTALYALPDHQVVTDLIPSVAERHLSLAQAIRVIRERPGLIPIAIDPSAGGRVLWADLGSHPFREWQFMYTVHRLAADGAIGEAFSTDMDILLADEILGDTISPSGLIFHISRCGSTLLAKALARSPRNIVINQGGPLQRGFWAYITDE